MAKREACKDCINNKNGWCMALKTNKIPNPLTQCEHKNIVVDDEVTNQNPLEILGVNSMVIAMEELAELQQAISKMIRYGNNTGNLEEEIADVLICIEWIKEYYNLDDVNIEAWKQVKRIRMKDRIAMGELR